MRDEKKLCYKNYLEKKGEMKKKKEDDWHLKRKIILASSQA